MKNKLIMMFYETGDYMALHSSISSFIEQNHAELGQFHIVIHLRKPDDETITAFKDLYTKYGVAISTGSKGICIPCILQRNKTRYGVVIPAGYDSVRPLWPYLDELRQVLSTTDNLSYVRLVPDTDSRNELTKDPLVYQYSTANVLIGNGNYTRDLPALVKAKIAHTKTSVTGQLKPRVFVKD